MWLADQVDPAVIAVEQGIERLGFDRCVAHDVEQLLVAPDVVLMRRDVEIAADQLPVLKCSSPNHALQLLEEIELVLEFRVHLGVGRVAAGRDIDRVDGQRAAAEIEAGRDVAAILDFAEHAARNVGRADASRRWRRRDSPSGRARRDAGSRPRQKPRAGTARCWHLISCRHRTSTGCFFEEFEHQRQPQADGVDVPGGEGGHGRTQGRTRQLNACNSRRCHPCQSRAAAADQPPGA